MKGAVVFARANVDLEAVDVHLLAVLARERHPAGLRIKLLEPEALDVRTYLIADDDVAGDSILMTAAIERKGMVESIVRGVDDSSEVVCHTVTRCAIIHWANIRT